MKRAILVEAGLARCFAPKSSSVHADLPEPRQIANVGRAARLHFHGTGPAGPTEPAAPVASSGGALARDRVFNQSLCGFGQFERDDDSIRVEPGDNAVEANCHPVDG